MIAAVIWLAWPSLAIGQAAAQDATAGFRVLEMLDRCSTSPTDEIVVCGARRNQDRYRVPEFGRRDAVGGAVPVPGEIPRASTEVAASGDCGIFQGQRRCSGAEMAEAGYGEGRDPITFLGALVTRLADPDADVRPPPPLP